ncbi:hypothetical protein [Adlercreutzia sp. ZJ242]|uniref:hypothetical protein n=1 Tax=Adlercreutzia sp. ZJ242 TaxID=2709409 RepID=UPI0013EC04F9|nr:hypothetical protein [Adlercreutzia sp. ZJ242]
MRKKFVAVACAAALALSMPTLAFATGSNQGGGPGTDTPTAPDNQGDDDLGPKPNTVYYSDVNYYSELNKVVGEISGTDKDSNPYSATVTLKDAKDVTIVPTDKKASNVDESIEYTRMQSFEITSKDFKAGDELVTVVWRPYEDAIGYVCYVYVEHGDGTKSESFCLPVDEEGKVTLTMGNLSTVTFGLTDQKFNQDAADKYNAKHNNGGKAQAVDNSAKSPKTGDAL